LIAPIYLNRSIEHPCSDGRFANMGRSGVRGAFVPY
jgi:hypothetical protein